MELVQWASEDMRSNILELQERADFLSNTGGDEEALEKAIMDLQEARKALEDRNAPAVEGALGRAIAPSSRQIPVQGSSLLNMNQWRPR